MSQSDTSGRTLLTTGTDSSDPPDLASETPTRTDQGSNLGTDMAGAGNTIVEWNSELPEGVVQPEVTGAIDSPVIQIGSTTLARLPASKRPNPSTVCEGCPAAMWYARGEKILNYCRLMHLISWETGEKEPVTSCDGPAIASQ